MCPPGFHRVTTSTTCRQLDLQDTESLVLKWWDCFLHLAWVLFWFTKISSSQYYQEFSKTQLCWFWSQYVELSMAPSYMYVYPHICNHFSWLRAWCWFRLKVNKRGQVQIIYGTGWTMHWIFSTLQVSCAPIYFWETACLHSLPPNFGWTSLGKKEPTFHMRWLCLFVFLLRLSYGWISFQARKKGPLVYWRTYTSPSFLHFLL